MKVLVSSSCTAQHYSPDDIPSAARPTSSAPADLGHHHDEIPQDIFDQIAAEEAAQSQGGGNSRVRICPHCTFENDHGGHDCEVCGLPLG